MLHVHTSSIRLVATIVLHACILNIDLLPNGMAYFRWGAGAEPSGSTGISIYSKSTNSSRVIRHQSCLNEHSPKLWHVIFAMQAHCSEEKKQYYTICTVVQRHVICMRAIVNAYKLHLHLSRITG